MPGNIASDFQMALDAGLLTGLLGGYPAMREKLKKVYNPDGSRKYSDAEIDDYIQRTKDKQAYDKKVAEEAKKNKSTTDDGTVGGVGTVVDPCPPGFKLDPASGICVPVEEAEEEGPSLSLNRSRDTEFEELDDIMKRIVKPVDDPVKMQAGGSVGLNERQITFWRLWVPKMIFERGRGSIYDLDANKSTTERSMELLHLTLCHLISLETLIPSQFVVAEILLKA